MEYKITMINTIILLIFTYPFIANSNSATNPQFSDFQIEVSTGPFATTILLSNQQEKFSTQWKNTMQEELNKPVNFAGHYRLYTAFGGHGKECSRDNWVCGWVIDKLTGKIESELPYDGGSNVYADIGDNGTPVGIAFEINAYKNSTLAVITGQAIPINDASKNYICKSVVYNFTKNKFKKIIESKDGCKVDE